MRRPVLARPLALALALALLPAAAAAQGGRTVPDSVFQRAQRLVMNGNGTDGRAMVDSLLRTVPYGSPDHAEALYWRAALAETAAEAERGYLTLVVEHPLARRTDEALFRLGQLELTRGNRAGALGRFERLAGDFPDSPQRGRALLAVGRIHLDERRPAPGCAALRAALQAAREEDAELRTQATFLSRQCTPAALATAERPPAPDPAPAPAVEPAAAEEAPAAPAPTPRPAARPAPRPASPPPAATPRPAPARPAPGRPAAASRPGFSVQVAAFDRAAPAEALAARLREQGHDVRVDEDGGWHRVRIGHHATRAEATAAAKRLKERGVEGFVTGVGGR